MPKNVFNKKIFSLLIEKSRGERSLKQYANECGISYMQMRKLWLCAQENPPRKALLKKISSCTHGGIDYEDFAFAAGIFEDESSNDIEKAQCNGICSKIDNLSIKQKKTVEDFVDFLLTYH